jgi:hypothetical protein
MKKAIIIALVLATIVATIPLWGGCDLNQRYCNATCSIKHFNNDMKAAGCRARCSMENAKCHGEEAAEGLNDFMSGLKGR